ncbi:Uncharacterised protein [Vibrio cholerae]|nr:Uncharacterised protein [Vibrio cholerae]
MAWAGNDRNFDHPIDGPPNVGGGFAISDRHQWCAG